MMPCINWGQQHLRAAALSTAEDGSVSHGGGTHRVIGTHSQSGQRVHSGLLDVCWVSEEFWLDAFAPADWKLVLPSAWGMERPPGAGLPSPNVLEGSFGFPWCSSRKKPSLMQSDVTPPQPVKETSLHVHSCHRALQQCAGGVCKKRWMQGSVGGGGILALCGFVLSAWKEHWAASCWGQRAEWKAAPCRDLLCPSATSLCSSLAVFGNEPPSLEEFMCSQVLDQQLPFTSHGTGVELASG